MQSYCREPSAIEIVQLHHMMFPNTPSSIECAKLNITSLAMVKVRTRYLRSTCMHNWVFYFIELFSGNELSQCSGTAREEFSVTRGEW